MRILLTNDDGVNAIGLKKLAEKLIPYATEMMIVAPMSQKSAVSHGITLRGGLKVEQRKDLIPGVKTYAIEGTPADCVIFASANLNYDYDVLFSGCNNGYNLSYDIIYSGTVSGAREAAMSHKKGVAISCQVDNFDSLKSFDQVMDYLEEHQLLEKCPLLNINFPETEKIKGIKMSFQGISDYSSHYTLKEDGLYYPTFANPQKMVNTDITSDWLTINAGYISITPLVVDTTDYKVFNEYKK